MCLFEVFTSQARCPASVAGGKGAADRASTNSLDVFAPGELQTGLSSPVGGEVRVDIPHQPKCLDHITLRGGNIRSWFVEEVQQRIAITQEHVLASTVFDSKNTGVFKKPARGWYRVLFPCDALCKSSCLTFRQVEREHERSAKAKTVALHAKQICDMFVTFVFT